MMRRLDRRVRCVEHTTTKAMGCLVPIIEPDRWSEAERMRYEAATSAGDGKTVHRLVEQRSGERLNWDHAQEGVILIEGRHAPSHVCEVAR
jgi:hypothetical protein